MFKKFLVAFALIACSLGVFNSEAQARRVVVRQRVVVRNRAVVVRRARVVVATPNVVVATPFVTVIR